MNQTQVRALKANDVIHCVNASPVVDLGERFTVTHNSGFKIHLAVDGQFQFALTMVEVEVYFDKHEPWINGAALAPAGLGHNTAVVLSSASRANAAIANMILNCREEK